MSFQKCFVAVVILSASFSIPMFASEPWDSEEEQGVLLAGPPTGVLTSNSRQTKPEISIAEQHRRYDYRKDNTGPCPTIFHDLARCADGCRIPGMAVAACCMGGGCLCPFALFSSKIVATLLSPVGLCFGFRGAVEVQALRDNKTLELRSGELPKWHKSRRLLQQDPVEHSMR